MEMYRCPDFMGVLVDCKRIPRVLDEMSRELLKTLSIDAPLERIEDKGRLRSCPRCHSETEHYGFMGSPHILLDCCKECTAVWLDTDELGAMSLLHARTQRRLEVARIDRKRQELGSPVARTVALRRATNRGLMLGWILGKLT